MRIVFVVILALVGAFSFAQSSERITGTDNNGYQYFTYRNDPLNSRTYILSNGLTVLLTVYKDEPRIQTFIAVRAGSKYDPANHTGLAHYLEHLMFKGTEKIGTSDWEKEKPYLNKIIALYETYGQTSDKNKRKEIYKQIDALSLLASKYAIPNEYDRLLSEMGATGTNAYTSFEQTVYVNEIPSNELAKWAKVEAERFSSFVPRLFHTELETVYEEKNRTLDSDYRQMNEALLQGLFPKHQYGTQTTIGTVKDLKKPSIKAIKEYHDTYYVPNNMAVCMSGDFKMEEAIQLIDKEFGGLKPKKLPIYVAPTEEPIREIIQKEVIGPNAEMVSLGFRFEGYAEKRSMMAELVSMLLNNGEAGLIDINLNQKQEIQGGYSYAYRLNDYSMHVLGGSPKQNQSLKEVEQKLLSQLELIKEGAFDEWLLDAIVNDYKLDALKKFENNKARAQVLLSSFVYQKEVGEYVGEIARLEKITKNDVVKFANKYYNKNYIVVYKKQGEAKREHVVKPHISQLPINRGQSSVFYDELVAHAVKEMKPKFTDFSQIKKVKLKKSVSLNYLENKENELFKLYYVFDIGTLHDQELALAVSYLNYLGTKSYSAEALQKEFYKMGCSFYVTVSDTKLQISLSGLNENMERGLQLFEQFLKKPIADQKAYDKLVDKIIKSRADKKTNKRAILTQGLVNYAKYGAKSPFTDVLSEKTLRNIAPKDLVKKIKSLTKYPHRVLYYGPENKSEVSALLKKHHRRCGKKTLPAMRTYPLLALDTAKVYFVDYDMVQSEVLLLSKSIPFTPAIIPQAKVYNEYFGGNMSSIVFQEIREARALAYRVYSRYSTANDTTKSNYIVSYVGTQSDKLPEALKAMNELLDEMPQSETTFVNSLTSLKKQIATSRVTKASILFREEKMRSMGLTKDINQLIYEQNPKLGDVVAFHSEYIKTPARIYLVIGKKSAIDWVALKKLGEVRKLSREEIFGY